LRNCDGLHADEFCGGSQGRKCKQENYTETQARGQLVERFDRLIFHAVETAALKVKDG
jgi:hypothetical protein